MTRRCCASLRASWAWVPAPRRARRSQQWPLQVRFPLVPLGSASAIPATRVPVGLLGPVSARGCSDWVSPTCVRAHSSLALCHLVHRQTLRRDFQSDWPSGRGLLFGVFFSVFSYTLSLLNLVLCSPLLLPSLASIAATTFFSSLLGKSLTSVSLGSFLRHYLVLCGSNYPSASPFRFTLGWFLCL